MVMVMVMVMVVVVVVGDEREAGGNKRNPLAGKRGFPSFQQDHSNRAPHSTPESIDYLRTSPLPLAFL